MGKMEKDFIEIFTGLKRNYGFADLSELVMDPETNKMRPKRYGWTHKEITDKDYIDHLNGRKSIGIQPCTDEGLVKFGAIDVDDQQGSYKGIPIKKILDTIREYDLPLIPVKSKSGGLHLYIFLKEFVKAVTVRNFLDTMLFTLKLKPTTEIYPKETELGKDEKGEYIDGHFINLPYYKKEERVGINLDGTPFTFEQFIQVVKANQKTADQLEEFSLAHVKTVIQGGPDELNDGPPCLQIMARDKLKDGRDRWLYNYMIFAKKKYPENWEAKVIQAPNDYFERNGDNINEWNQKKVEDKIKSWRKDSSKGHTCTQDPIVNYCMKSQCLKRQYGVLSDKKKVFPALSSLQKIAYPEPEYTFNVDLPDGRRPLVRAKNIKQIMLQEELRAIIMKTANIFVPAIKSNDFQEVVDRLFPPKETIQPPKGTSPNEQLEEYLREYINGPQAKSHASFKTGAVLIEKEHAYFRFVSFYNFLKNKEWKESKGHTGEKLKELFKVEFGIQKRFPKKDNEKTSYGGIEVIEVPIEKFKKESSEVEILPIRNKDEIF